MRAGARPGRPRRDRAQLRAAGARRRAGARCARSSRPTATGTARCPPRAPRRPAARAWLAVATARRGGRAARRRASTGRCSSWARCRRGADRRAAARAPTSSPGARGSSPRVAAHPDGEGAGVHVKLDTGMGRLGTRDAAEATRTAAAVAAAPRLRLAGAMTHFATADDDPALRARAARALPALGRALRAAHGDAAAARRQLRRDARASRRRASDMVRCGIAVYGMDPFRRGPGAPRARARARAALLRRRGQAARAGRERRLRPPLRRRRADLDRHGADRLRATACAAR